jgi:acyl-CoA reductase-like NAD-dependent aldehyde dehydrogenase
VIPFRGEADAVRIGNDGRYGLAGVVYARDGARAMRMSRTLQIGNIAINDPIKATINAPFGGFEEFGLGKENAVPTQSSRTPKSSMFASRCDDSSISWEGQLASAADDANQMID